MKRNIFDKFLYYLIVVVVSLFALSIILPLLNIISSSVSKTAIYGNRVMFIPRGISFLAYYEIIRQKIFQTSLLNTIFITVASTALSLFVIVLSAYAFTKEFPFKKFLTYVFIITMYFGGGLIPTFIVMTRILNLYNSYLAFILPGAVNIFYLIIVRSQIESVPSSLVDAAYIDGAPEFILLTKVIIPTIIPTIMAISMFVALANWNMWFPVLLYTNRRSMWTLQYYLRAVIISRTAQLEQADELVGMLEGLSELTSANYRNAAIILVALPIIGIYPFVQKYFVKGIIAGAVKG